jgi:hypothetical protein
MPAQEWIATRLQGEICSVGNKFVDRCAAAAIIIVIIDYDYAVGGRPIGYRRQAVYHRIVPVAVGLDERNVPRRSRSAARLARSRDASEICRAIP